MCLIAKTQLLWKQCRGIGPSLLILYAEYIMRNSGLDETYSGIKIAKEISVT